MQQGNEDGNASKESFILNRFEEVTVMCLDH